MAEQLASVRRLYEIETSRTKWWTDESHTPRITQMLNDGYLSEFRWIATPYFLGQTATNVPLQKCVI